MTVKDGTIALCATCRRAIYCWRDIAFADFYTGEALEPPAYWTHFVPPSDRHDALPMTSQLGRVLLCTGCHRPQLLSEGQWVCQNPNCPHLDND